MRVILYMNISAIYNQTYSYLNLKPQSIEESKMISRLHRDTKKGLVVKVRKGVYMPEEVDNKFVVGCNAVEDGVLSYHSALEYHLLQTQEFNTLYIHSPKKFRDFVYLGERYKHKPLKFLINPIEQEFFPGYKVRVTNPSQTLIDCLYNINLAGGIEELIYAIMECPAEIISESQLVECLKAYGNKSLWQRTGYIFELLKNPQNLSPEFFSQCKKYSGETMSYLIQPYHCNLYNKEWNIYVPENIIDSIK